MTTMVRIASVNSVNKELLERILKEHNVTYRFDPYEDCLGYHVFVHLNHELYFREVITQIYQTAKNITPEYVENLCGH